MASFADPAYLVFRLTQLGLGKIEVIILVQET
jgi:hypothetical protein